MTQIWLRIPNRPMSLKEFRDVQRDICYLYHELAKYCGVMGDLNYHEVYSLPYWEYLNLSGLATHEKAFIQTGCLVVVLAMAWENLSDAGSYITQASRINHISNALKTIEGDDADFYRLVETVRFAIDLVQSNLLEKDNQIIKLSNETAWVFRNYIIGYFQQVAESCVEN